MKYMSAAPLASEIMSLFLAAFALVAACTPAAPAAEPRQMMWEKALTVPRLSTEKILWIDFDDEIYMHTQPDYADLRIFDNAEIEIPRLLEKARVMETETVRQRVPAEIIDFAEGPDNVISVVLMPTSREQPPTQLEIATPLTDFEKRIDIAGSNDQINWTPLAADQPIYDYSRYIDVRNTAVAIPAPTFRYYRVSIQNVTDLQTSPLMQFGRETSAAGDVRQFGTTMLARRDFRIDQIVLWAYTTEKRIKAERKQAYAVRRFEVKENPDATRTEIAIWTSRQPLTSFSIKTASRNFNRPVVVQRRGTGPDNKGWVDIGHGTISNLAFPAITKTSVNIAFPEQRAEEYRLLILNGDSPPLEIMWVESEGNVYQAWFVGKPDVEYRLLYGNPHLPLPRYDVAAVAAGMGNTRNIAAAQLGGEEKNPAFSGLGLSGWAVLESRLLLGVAVALMVLGLGWAVFSTYRRVEASDAE